MSYAKFKKDSERRTNLILKQIKTLNIASNPYKYKYTKEDIDKIFKAIREAVGKSKKQFYNSLAEKELREQQPFHF